MSRELTRSQRDWLEGEIAVWQAMGLVDEDRAKAILGLYDSQESFRARRQSRGMFTLLALSAILVGLGVLLLIGYNWEQMPAPFKITAIFGALIGTHAAGFDLRYRLGWRPLSEVAFFMGCLLFGAAIWLLAQIFHIESSNYDALWWWAIGVLPLALLLDTILLHLLFAGLLALWLGLEVFSLDRLIWGVPSAGYSLPLLVAPGLWWAYRKSSATTVGIYVPLLAWWVVLQPIAWKLQANPTCFIGAIGSLMLLVAAMHAPRSEMAIPYRFYGIALVGATLVPLSFYQFNGELVRNSSTVFMGGLEQMILILILTAATLIAAYFLQRKSYDDVQQAHGWLAGSLRQIVTRQSLPLGLLALFAFLAVLGTTVSEPLVSTIAANIAMVAVALWLIRFGLTEDQSRPFGAGVVYLFVQASSSPSPRRPAYSSGEPPRPMAGRRTASSRFMCRRGPVTTTKTPCAVAGSGRKSRSTAEALPHWSASSSSERRTEFHWTLPQDQCLSAKCGRILPTPNCLARTAR
jgi:uncharacterized membrane protein